MSKQYIGYIAEVTEFESGWGCRPDGFIICLDKEKGKEFATRENGHVWCMDDGSEFSSAGEFKMVALTDDGYDDLISRSSGLAWQPNSDFKKYVKEM